MLKWTAMAQKLPTAETPGRVPVMRTPRFNENGKLKRARRATIANKENVPYVTSTPMSTTATAIRLRSSPIVLAPLTDILNITPESRAVSPINHTPDTQIRQNVTERIGQPLIRPIARHGTSSALTRRHLNIVPNYRRHSTIGITLPSAVPEYSTTLPRFEEEEYSPQQTMPTGQQIALRGLVPEPFFSNLRYFKTPENRLRVKEQREEKHTERNVSAERRSLPRKRLEPEFDDDPDMNLSAKRSRCFSRNLSGINSAKMGDQTLDHLIDAILDSARKEEKKRKPRKSFNLRRRTLLKNQTDNMSNLILSPSYTACDDPASDLSFLHNEGMHQNRKLSEAKQLFVPTPTPATPVPGTPIPQRILCEMPTPKPATPTIAFDETPTSKMWTAKDDSTKTFKLETPVCLKRRKEKRADGSHPKKYKVDEEKYFEIGVALPSIYV